MRRGDSSGGSAGPKRRRTTGGGPQRLLRGLRAALRTARRCGVQHGAAGREVFGRSRRPGVRGIREGARHAPRRARAQHCLPRLPTDRPAQHRLRPHPSGTKGAARRRRRGGVGRRRQRAVHRHGGRRAGAHARRAGVRPATGTLADRAVARRGRGPDPGRGGAVARVEPQRGFRARLPGSRGAPPGLPAGAPRAAERRRIQCGAMPGHRRTARCVDPERAVQAGNGPGGSAP